MLERLPPVPYNRAMASIVPEFADLASLPDRLATATVLVLGDVMLDRFVDGDVKRLSPEAPIPVLRARGGRATLGGAANVAANIAALGGRAILIGMVGDDEAGAELGRLLASVSGIEPHLTVTPARPTTVKTRFMSGSHQLLRVDEESHDPLDRDCLARMLADYQSALPASGVVILSDYAKGVLSDAMLEAAIRSARVASRPVIADPKRADFIGYRGVNLLTPNAHEVATASGIEAQDDAGAVAAGEAAMRRAESDGVLVTRSEKGLTLVRRDAPPLHLPTDAREVADVTGAGDTLIAALATALAAGASLPVACRLGNLAAGIAVSHYGTVTVAAETLRQSIRTARSVGLDHKIASLPEALERIAGWRREGLRVGFTNGCFDLIHPGHVGLLAEARAACDRLVVGLNSDQSVRRLKGPTRPVQDEAARATVMASLAATDLVVLFAEDTPIELIRAIMPDVLVKGADYSIDQVVGADIVQAAGGSVVLVDLREGHSTTRTISRINQGP